MLLPLLLLLQAGPTVAETGRPATVYDGFMQETTVVIPRLEGELRVDGVMDEAVWGQAAILTGFSQFSPRDGVRASDSTRVRVWYSSEAIYFGIQAFEPHGPVNARLSDRDRIQNDDNVQILLDTFHDGRRAYVFAVNALGIQSDGIRTEAQSGGHQGLMSIRQADPVDLSPDYVYESAGSLTEYGYEVELRIPFQSLRFPNLDDQSWGIHVIRNVQHSGEVQTWAPALRGRSSFLAQSGTLEGLTGIQQRQRFDINPVMTVQALGAPRETEVGEGWKYRTDRPEVGINSGWGITPNLTLSLTANPDFSQVESDAGQLSFDPRRALFFAEKRPFFLEGSERFQVPNRLIYTRRIASPDGALKLTGKLSRWDVGLLTAIDGRSVSLFDERAFAQVARIQRDVGSESTVGFLLTDRREGDFSSSVIGGDTRLNFAEVYTFSAQAAASSTSHGAGDSRGALWDISLRRSGRAVAFEAAFQGIDPDFVAANGFLSRVNVVNTRLNASHTLYGDAGATMESWTRGLSLSASWLREGFLGSESHIEDWKIHLNNNAVLRGGWGVGASLLVERFFYPPYLYAGYAVERRDGAARDTVPFVGTPAIMNYDLVIRMATPRSPHFSGSLLWIVGRDENFDEWAPGWVHILSSSLQWRPSDQLRVEPSYLLQHYIRPDDRSTVSLTNVPRLKLEYQATRSVFFRAVGEYRATYRDALRDDTRTNHPLLIRDASGVYRLTEEVRRNTLRVDWLFSFRPSPGTVVFAGYGGSMSEAQAFRLREMQRSSDQFFVKLSYLLRR